MSELRGPEGVEVTEQHGVGVPDALQRLWTPHRMAYIQGENKPVGSDSDGCPFCRLLDSGLPDSETLIVAREELVFAILNLYPYNPGHLMVLPYRHVADYTELTPEETVAVAEQTQHAMRVIRHVSAPHGFNIGLNQGPVAGAGIADHLHQHVVPRWGGDSNFMPVIGHTKVLPQLLGETRRLLADAWHTVS
ncbi:HIT family protein [Saccharopolyspora rosea]|uniref:HIT family protein n=1 Tax=Saccharopolyspora rosea TaxID=524884 RepID=A0ABW3FYK7_9PSEU